MKTKSFLQWSLVCLIFLFLIGLTGCADLRRLTMTKDEMRFFGSLTFRQCLSPDVVCIKEK
jgi:hypothetical protein